MLLHLDDWIGQFKARDPRTEISYSQKMLHDKNPLLHRDRIYRSKIAIKPCSPSAEKVVSCYDLKILEWTLNDTQSMILRTKYRICVFCMYKLQYTRMFHLKMESIGLRSSSLHFSIIHVTLNGRVLFVKVGLIKLIWIHFHSIIIN